MPSDQSWHISYIDKYRAPNPDTILNVVYLQRMSDSERQKVEQALNSIDQNAINQLSFPQTAAPRELRFRKWIRDNPCSPSATFEIAKDAYHKQYNSDESYRSIIFVDSGWVQGSVIAAHWHQDGESTQAKLHAARVPAGVANVLLTSCDQNNGITLPQGLGENAFKDAQVNFYKDLPPTEEGDAVSETSEHTWPSHLPDTLCLAKSSPAIVSLRSLDDRTIRRLTREINGTLDENKTDIRIYNWGGPEPTERLLIRDIYNQMQRRTPEADQQMYAFFIDYMLQGENGEPQILAVHRIPRDPGVGVEVLPLSAPSFMTAWKKAAQGEELDQDADIIDIWKKEHVDRLDTATSGKPISSLVKHGYPADRARECDHILSGILPPPLNPRRRAPRTVRRLRFG